MGDFKLSEEKLLQFFRTYIGNDNMTLEDLRSPKPSTIMAILEGFLKALFVNIESIYTPPLSAYEALENGGWYEDVLPLATFKFIVSETVQFSGIMDMGITDLLEPKPKRTKKILNYLIPLWRNVGLKGVRYNKIVEMYDAENERKRQYMSDIEESDRQIEEKSRYVQQMKEAASDDLVTSERFKEISTKKDVVCDQYQAMKTKEVDLLKKQSDTDVNIATLKEKFEELDKMILKSPQRLSEDVELYKQKILEMDSKSKEIHLKMEEKKKHCDNLKEQLEQSVALIELVEDIGAGVMQLREISNQAEFQQNKMKLENEKVQRQHSDLEKEEEQLYFREQLRTRNQLNGQKRIDALKEMIAMSERDHAKMSLALDVRKNEFLKSKMVLKDTIQTATVIKKKTEDLIEKVSRDYTRLQEMVTNYADEAENEIDESNAILDRCLP